MTSQPGNLLQVSPSQCIKSGGTLPTLCLMYLCVTPLVSQSWLAVLIVCAGSKWLRLLSLFPWVSLFWTQPVWLMPSFPTKQFLFSHPWGWILYSGPFSPYFISSSITNSLVTSMVTVLFCIHCTWPPPGYSYHHASSISQISFLAYSYLDGLHWDLLYFLDIGHWTLFCLSWG